MGPLDPTRPEAPPSTSPSWDEDGNGGRGGRLPVLSDTILAAMGWKNSHLHQFQAGRVLVGMREYSGSYRCCAASIGRKPYRAEKGPRNAVRIQWPCLGVAVGVGVGVGAGVAVGPGLGAPPFDVGGRVKLLMVVPPRQPASIADAAKTTTRNARIALSFYARAKRLARVEFLTTTAKRPNEAVRYTVTDAGSAQNIEPPTEDLNYGMACTAFASASKSPPLAI